MKLLNDLIKRLEEFEKGLSSGFFVQTIILENEAYIVDLNAQNQLFEQGINSVGIDIADYMPYSDLTISIKTALGQPTNRVTLRDEGDFESSFYIQVDDKQFTIKASDWKTEKLMIKYGDEILGLTQENIRNLIKDYILPGILEQRKRLVYGKN